MKKNKKAKTITNSILYNTIGSGIYLFAQWLILYIVLWISGYKQEGMFSAVMAVSAIFYAFSLFGMRNYQATDLKQEHSEKTYMYTRIITYLLSFILCIIYCFYLKYDAYMILCVAAYMGFKFSEAIIDFIHGTIQKKWMFKNISISFIIRAFVFFASFTLSLLTTKNILLSIIIMGITTLISVYLYDGRIYIKTINSFGNSSYEEIKKLIIICLPLAVYTLLSNYALSYPKIVIGKILGNKILGYYATYANLAMMVQVAAGFITSPLITYFAELYQKKDRSKIKISLLKCIGIIVGIGIIGIFICTLFGKPIFNLLFGKAIIKYYYLLNQMIIISLLTALMWLFTGIITIIRKFNILIITNVFYCALMILFSAQIVRYGLSTLNYYIIGLISILNIIYYLYIMYYIKEKMNEEKN